MKKVTQNVKSERGVTLVALVAMMIIIFTTISIVLYNGRASVRLEKLNNMYNDIAVLEEKIQLYYIKNGTLPISGEPQTFSAEDSNPNDEEDAYYKIDLNLLGDVNIENSINDYYVNKTTLTVYSKSGYEYDGITYRTIPRTYANIDLTYDADTEYMITLNYKGSTDKVEELTYTGKHTLPQSGADLSSYTTGSYYNKRTYYFNGWLGNDGKYYRYAYKGVPTSVTAQWTKSTNNITVTFWDGTTEVEKRTYSIGEKFGELPKMVSSSGKKFIGWMNESGDIVTADMLVNSNETDIYAKWEISGNASFVVTFDPLEGTVSPDKKTVRNNNLFGELPVPVANKTKYKFEGWYTDTEFTNKVTAETRVQLTGNITLYAKYIQYKYTVTFDFNEPGNYNYGDETEITKEYETGEAYGELPEPENKIIYINWGSNKGVYDFKGWSTNRNATVPNVTEDTIFNSERDITVYAVWEKRSSSQGGSGGF